MAEIEDGEILEEGELLDSETDEPSVIDKDKIPDATVPSSFTELRQEVKSSTKSNASLSYRPNIVGSNSDSDNDDSCDSDDDSALLKCKRSKHVSMDTHSTDAPAFQNPLPPVDMSRVNYGNQSNSHALFTPTANKRKNNVWGSVLTEQTLTQDLVQFGNVDKNQELDNYRNVESYDYTKALDDDRPYLEVEDDVEESNDPFDSVLESACSNDQERRALKRKREPKQRLGPRVQERLGPRVDVTAVTEEDSVEKVVGAIAETLREPKIGLLRRVVDILGKKKALQLMAMTLDIEDSGGMLVLDGSRRRTPGGIYIQLIKTDTGITREQCKEVFAEEERQIQLSKKQSKSRSRRRKVDKYRTAVQSCKLEGDNLGNEMNKMDSRQEERDNMVSTEMDVKPCEMDVKQCEMDVKPCEMDVKPCEIDSLKVEPDHSQTSRMDSETGECHTGAGDKDCRTGTTEQDVEISITVEEGETID